MLYALRRIPEGFCVLKCDEDFTYHGSYLIVRAESGYKCSCPATVECRHIKMIPVFEKQDRFDTPWYFDVEGQKWVKVI